MMRYCIQRINTHIQIGSRIIKYEGEEKEKLDT